MFNKVLDCPKCKYRFGFDYEYYIPDDITCPSCGESCPASDYSFLTFCSDCHAKLKISLDYINESNLACP